MRSTYVKLRVIESGGSSGLFIDIYFITITSLELFYLDLPNARRDPPDVYRIAGARPLLTDWTLTIVISKLPISASQGSIIEP